MGERAEQATFGAHKVELHLAKWENGRTPADGAPDEVIVSSVWYEADGTEAVDPQRIAQLESKAQGE